VHVFWKPRSRLEEKAGLGLIEAVSTDDTQGAGEFWDWASSTFDRPKKILRTYMEIAFENNKLENGGVAYETLGDLMRAKKKQDRSGKQSAAGGAIRADMDSVKPQAFAAPPLKLSNERALRRELALKLIDVGYKALATKLHPDKNRGGSNEAMVRLNEVRKILKAAVR
jgi:hypothetical protein